MGRVNYMNNNNASWIQIMSAEIIGIGRIFEKYEGEELKEILKYLEDIPQEDESVQIPTLRDGEYTIIAKEKIVKGCEYNPETDDLDEVVGERILKKRFLVANERLYRNDKMAVIITKNYGAGWYTWFQEPKLLTHPLLVKRIEQGLPITLQWIKKNLNINLKGCSEDLIKRQQLQIKWVPRGCSFRVTEYDGAESIEYFNPADYILA